jgi:tetratricopeptide (TPR) repeat protein
MQIAHDRMVLAESRRPDTEALPLARQAETWMEKYLAGGKVDEFDKQQVVIAGMNIAYWYSRKDLTDESLRLTRRTIELAKAQNLPAQAAAAQITAARALRSMGDLDGALAAIRDGVHLLEPLHTNAGSAQSFAQVLSTEGDVLGSDRGISMGRYREAADSFDRAYRMVLPLARQDAHNELIQRFAADRAVKLAGVVRLGDARKSVDLYDEALALLARVTDNQAARRIEVRALAESTYPLRQLGRSAEARQRLETAFLRMREIKLYPAETIEPGSVPVDGLRAQAEMEAGAGNLRRGIEIYRELIGKLTPMIKPETRLEDATELSDVYRALVQLHRRARRPDLASAVDARRLELWRQWDRKLPNNPFVQRQLASLAPNK